MGSKLLEVECRQCHRQGPADLVARHLDGKLIVRCGFCNSTNVRIIGISAPNGKRLTRAHMVVGRLVDRKDLSHV